MLLAAAAMQLAFAAETEPASTSFLDGKWEGELKRTNDPPTLTRLYIQGKTAQVYIRDDHDRWLEAKTGKFRVVQHNFNAVIFASDSSAGDCWDETWSFAVALDVDNQLLTTFSRVVSNVRCLMPKSESFGAQAAGKLKQQAAESIAPAH
jgi:hypothetical protein